ncbi:hypothetical protein CRM22_005148 [Opisthorchis felineus]|uniref:Uncharacterized protein n=1 Tax=Opisthorchis felineus TaxID=147828 RepID=A0A4S2LSI4_OPIFE|nr:hypothetical protein CRM22_005148 [Opisthorchis felineus]
MRVVKKCKTCKIVTITPEAFVYRCSHTPCRKNDPDEFCCTTSLCNEPKGTYSIDFTCNQMRIDKPRPSTIDQKWLLNSTFNFEWIVI